MSKALLKSDKIQCSPLVHKASCLIIEEYKVGLAWFPLHKSMLTMPDHHLVLQTSENAFQDYLLHYLPKNPGKDDWPVAHQTFLLALFEGRSNICFLLVLRNYFK